MGHLRVMSEAETDSTGRRAQQADGSALLRAVQHGQVRAVRRLLDAGADVNTKNKAGNTVLMTATRKGYVEVVGVLLDSGANVNAKNTLNNTALMLAALRGHVEAVRFCSTPEPM